MERREQTEHCFSMMKAYFKRHRRMASRHSTTTMIARALNNITPNAVFNSVIHDWGAFWEPIS